MSDLTLKQLQNLEFTILLPDGTTLNDTLELADVVLHRYLGTVCILGLGLGLIIILSFLLTVVARTYKSILFCLYQTNFCLGLILYSITIRTYMEPSHNITATYFGIDASSSDVRLGVVGSFVSLFYVFSLLCSLCFQVYTAYKDIESLKIKLAVVTLLFLSCFQTVFIWIWSVVLVVIASQTPGAMTDSWANNALWPSFGASTMACSLLLSLRLYSIVRSRAKLGLERFDAIKIILIVALQNATIPAFFAIFYGIFGDNKNIPQAVGALTTILCCTFFPMGYIWAQAYAGTDKGQKRPDLVMRAVNQMNGMDVDDPSNWNGGAPTPTSGNSAAEYDVEKDGMRHKTQEIE